jgi:hypothetical protein
MADDNGAGSFQTIFPPETFTAEQQTCYWAYDTYVRTMLEERGLTPEEACVDPCSAMFFFF